MYHVMSGQHHFDQMRLELAHAKAERIIGEELRRLGWAGSATGVATQA